MTEKLKHKSETDPSPDIPILALGLAAIGFCIAVVARTDLAWVFLLCFLVFAYGCWRGLTRKQQRVTARAVDTSTALQVMEADKAVVEAMQHPVLIIDGRGDVIFTNAASERVFGEMRLGERIFIRFRQPDLKRVIERVLDTKEAMKIEYNEPVPADRWFAVEVSPIKAPSSDVTRREQRFIVSFQDLTETKRIDQMRSDFIANASHELRTPLASLLGYLETLKGPAKNDAKASARFVDIMLEQAERMSRLVNDLLSLSRIEMKSHVRPSESVNLSEVVGSVADALEPLAEQMNVEIHRHLEGDYPVNGDRDELVQVFENIVENACKYGQDGEKVEVSIQVEEEADQKYATVSVRDYGPGIATEHQHRITERFYRVDVARSREKQGTGLGLAIVKHILHRHGTRLKLSSALNEGSEFSVRFRLLDRHP